jgi:hypothetical protein
MLCHNIVWCVHVFPLLHTGQRAEVGFRYSSPDWTAGLVLQPATNRLSQVWLCGRGNGITGGPGERVVWAVRARGGSCLHTWSLLLLLMHTIMCPLPLLAQMSAGLHPAFPCVPLTSSCFSPYPAAGIQLLPDLKLHDAPGSIRDALAASHPSAVASTAAAAEALLVKAGVGGAPPAVAAGGQVDGAALGSWLRAVSNVAVSYSPPGRTRSGELLYWHSVGCLPTCLRAQPSGHSCQHAVRLHLPDDCSWAGAHLHLPLLLTRHLATEAQQWSLGCHTLNRAEAADADMSLHHLMAGDVLLAPTPTTPLLLAPAGAVLQASPPSQPRWRCSRATPSWCPFSRWG